MSSPSSYLHDPRGNPSRWVALVLATMFGLGAIAAAVLGHGTRVTAVLSVMFVVSFNTAFGRPGVSQIVIAFARRPSGGARGGRGP